MPTAALFANGRSQAVRIPKEFEFDGIKEVEITKKGDSLIIRPVRPSWTSLLDFEKADADFLQERPPVIDESRMMDL